MMARPSPGPSGRARPPLPLGDAALDRFHVHRRRSVDRLEAARENPPPL